MSTNLSYVFQSFLFPAQAESDRVLYDGMGKVYYLIIISGWEQHHLTSFWQLLVNSHWLILKKWKECKTFWLFVLKYINNWINKYIRIKLTWWPWVAIITSASSKTNTLQVRRSRHRYLTAQSTTLPGVPITICSVTFCPRGTENIKEQWTKIYI